METFLAYVILGSVAVGAVAFAAILVGIAYVVWTEIIPVYDYYN